MVGQVFNAGAARRTTKKIIVLSTPGTSTWTVPADWNNSSNEIHCIGGGQPGGESGSTKAYGGAGGDYARILNLTLTPGASENYKVAAATGYSGFNALADPGDDTWFGGTGIGDSDVVAKGGGSNNTSSGDVVFAGGAAGPPRSYGRGGGGGAAGFAGPGGNGGPGRSAGSATEAGGGGGGANGGSAGQQDVPNDDRDGEGGNNRFGVGGGNTRTTQFANPSDGGGGGGGSTNSSTHVTTQGQNGSSELWVTSTVDGEIVRIGGGGGGHARSSGTGGNGGLYGGGGGGDKGVGAQGVIVIVYEGTA